MFDPNSWLHIIEVVAVFWVLIVLVAVFTSSYKD